MNLSDLVPARDRCEALRDAGMPQEMVFSWRRRADPPFLALTNDSLPEGYQLAAPLVSEMLEWLPPYTRSEKTPDKRWHVWNVDFGGEFHGEKPSNALADLLLWAVKEGHVKW